MSIRFPYLIFGMMSKIIQRIVATCHKGHHVLSSLNTISLIPGHRYGNTFYCECEAGYELSDDNHSCLDIDECQAADHCDHVRLFIYWGQGSYREKWWEWMLLVNAHIWKGMLPLRSLHKEWYLANVYKKTWFYFIIFLFDQTILHNPFRFFITFLSATFLWKCFNY